MALDSYKTYLQVYGLNLNWATKKTKMRSIESWLFNKDPYVMVYEIIPI